MFLKRDAVFLLLRAWVALAAGWSCVLAGPLTTAEQVHRLSLKESRMKIPVQLSGVVTYVRGIGREVVIQDETGA